MKDCPKVPADKKHWTWKQHLAAKRKREKGASSAPRGEPRGGDPGGEKKSLSVSEAFCPVCEDGPEAKVECAGADGVAVVGGVEGFWTADGGCDKATVGEKFAEAMVANGVEKIEYKKWKNAKLADGTVKPMISGYLIADIVLRTKAGEVLLPKTHIDILQGPENGQLLYIGAKEEARLGFTSFKKQIEKLAVDIRDGKKEQPVAPKQKKNTGEVQTKCAGSDGGFRTVRFEAGKQPAYKRRLQMGSSDDTFGRAAGMIKADGFAFAGERNWQAQQKTKYVMDPKVQGIYVTSAAVLGQDLKLAKEPPPHPVKTYDLTPDMRKWLGDEKGVYTCEIKLDLRLGPDGNRDTIERLTNLPQVTAKVVESEIDAVIVGFEHIEMLTERKNESLEFVEKRSPEEAEKIRTRLLDVIDNARLQGMSEAGIQEGVELLREEFPDIWRLTLGPQDYADVPPLEMELIDPEQRLPKPYSRRYTKRELTWWKRHIDALLKGRIIQKATTKELSSANLVDKFKDGVVMLDDHRMVIDLRARNSNAKTRHFHLPRLDDMWQHLLGAKCFASADATKGYLQFLLAVASRKYAGFLTPFGAYELCRVPMGWVDAAPYYQEMMTGVLDDLIYQCVLQYLDDSLIYAKNERGLLDALRAYFTVLKKHNIKLHPGKFVMYARNLTWGGKDLSADGVAPAEHRLRSVKEMPEPTTLAEAMSFVYGVAWFRNHIPYFAEIAGPLYDLWNEAMKGKKRRTTKAASKIKLADLPGWKNGAKKAFEAVKHGLVEALRTSFYDPEMRTCVFADASDEFWCICITQCKDGDQLLPWSEQVGKHKPLLFESGRFRKAQLHCHTVSKESFAFGEKLFDYKHWINGGKFKSDLFTDHKNLLALFDDKARPETCNKSNRKRMDRWAEQLRTMRYRIHHIDGDENRLADLGSRWGNRFAKAKVQEAAGGLSDFSPKQFLRGFIREADTEASRGPCRCQFVEDAVPRACLPVSSAPKRVLWTPEPKVTKTVTHPDRAVSADEMLPKDLSKVNAKRIRDSQNKFAGQRPDGVHREGGARGWWVNKQGEKWIPDQDKELQLLLYAAAHQGVSGHRGRKTTLGRLEGHFFWTTMVKDVEKWSRQCLQCIKLTDGSSIPRPLGTSLVAEAPGEIFMMDYIDMGEESEGCRYVLMGADKFSRLAELTATAGPTAIEATKGTLKWSAKYGLPEWIITDGGSHFKNKAMKMLTDQMGIQHHITLAYCPWANGSIEIVGKELLWTTRAVLSELGYSATDWTLVLPLINYVLNHREREVLGRRTPIEVMTGRKPIQPTKLVVWDGVLLKDATGLAVEWDRVARHCHRLAAALDRVHQRVRDQEEERRRRKLAKAANASRGLQFSVGDLVMVAAWGNAAHVKRGSKLCPSWQGPYEVVAPISTTAYEVRLIGRPDKKPKPVHWSRMKLFANGNFDVSEQLKRTAVNDCQKFDVHQFMGWRFDDDDNLQLQVRWEGFEPQDDTWEDIDRLHDDVPVLVLKYLNEHADDDDRIEEVIADLT